MTQQPQPVNRPPRWALGLYDLACHLALPALLPLMALHPRLRGSLGQRFGAWPESGAGAGPTVLLHGASAGDLVALAPLARRLGESGHSPLLSSWTRAGQQLVTRRFGQRLRCLRAPLDLSLVVRRALGRARPALLVLECLELWPRLVTECAARGVPVAVVNGRLSRRSLRRYQRWPALFEPCFRSLALVSALDEQQAARFVAAGVDPRRLVIHHSSKYGDLQRGQLLPRNSAVPKLVLGSIHAEEEPSLLALLESLKQHAGPLELVLAPRYPRRARALLRRLGALGMEGALLSRLGEARPQGARVVVVDRMGELAAQYRGADVVFVGGSLTHRGGHNVMEPAAAGAAVLVGPHHDNCLHEVQQLTRHRAARVVRDGRELERAVLGLLARPGRSRAMGRAGRQVALELAGACDQIAGQLVQLVQERC